MFMFHCHYWEWDQLCFLVWPSMHCTLLDDMEFMPSYRISYRGMASIVTVMPEWTTCWCATCTQNNSTAELLAVKGIQLPLIFSWRFLQQYAVVDFCPTVYIMTSSVLVHRHHLREFPTLFLVSSQHHQNIQQAGQGCLANTWSFSVGYTKWIGWWG